MKPRPRRKRNQAEALLTDVEWEIMRVVWQHGPCAAGTVQEELHDRKGWAYSTVKTTMDRMEAKGLLSVTSIRNLQLFSAAVSEGDAKRGEVLRTLQRAFKGALTPMLQFLLADENLSAKELNQLRQVLEEAAKRKG